MNHLPRVYVIYGITGSGRRSIIGDLIADGIEQNREVLCFLPENEPAISDIDSAIGQSASTTVLQWSLNKAKVMHGPIQANPEVIFFLSPGDSDPADTAEAVKSWAEHNRCEVTRLITVVHCSFLRKSPEAKAWYNACIHFSDVVLMNRREPGDNKWVRQFEEHFKKQHCPSRFLPVKNDRVANPAEILCPETRRESLYFDELTPIEEDAFEEDLPEDRKPDKYIERLESGLRAHPIPSIKKWIV